MNGEHGNQAKIKEDQSNCVSEADNQKILNTVFFKQTEEEKRMILETAG